MGVVWGCPGLIGELPQEWVTPPKVCEVTTIVCLRLVVANMTAMVVGSGNSERVMWHVMCHISSVTGWSVTPFKAYSIWLADRDRDAHRMLVLPNLVCTLPA